MKAQHSSEGIWIKHSCLLNNSREKTDHSVNVVLSNSLLPWTAQSLQAALCSVHRIHPKQEYWNGFFHLLLRGSSPNNPDWALISLMSANIGGGYELTTTEPGANIRRKPSGKYLGVTTISWRDWSGVKVVSMGKEQESRDRKYAQRRSSSGSQKGNMSFEGFNGEMGVIMIDKQIRTPKKWIWRSGL